MSKSTQSLKNYLEKLAKGDLSAEPDSSLVSKGNDLGQIARLAKIVQQNMKEHTANLNKIANGDLEIKLSNASLNDELGKSIENVAKKISGFYGEITSVCDGITEGKTDLRGDDSHFQGCYKKILQDVNTGFDALIDPVVEVEKALNMLVKNDFSYRITKEFKGNSSKFTESINDFSERLDALAASVARIADGDTSDLEKYKKIGRRSENDKITPAMYAITLSIENLLSVTERLAGDAANGRIIVNSCDSSAFNGKYKSIVESLNNMLANVSVPLKDLSRVLAAVAVNDYTLDMSDSYSGDFKDISSSMSEVSVRLRYLQKLASNISRGDISELENVKKFGKRSENDHLVPAFTRMMESIQKLIVQTEAFASAAIDGNFDYQCDTKQFEGEFKVIIINFDNMFRQVAGYIHEVYDVMSKMSEAGDLNVSMKDVHKGKLGKVADAINLTVERIRNVTTDISRVLGQVSEGNLALDNVRNYLGDYRPISDALNKIVSALNEIMGSISDAAEQVAAGSSQVAVGSQNLSQGTAEQASTIEELTASISEIASQTKANAEDANKASEFEITVKENARVGMSQMNEMLSSMDELKTSSTSISKIIKTIDDIAFQTNILALNAAVEAARAGQAGKGFAVVADEVRNLAAKSAKASSETTALIEETISKVTHGNEITIKTANKLNNIADGIDKVETLISKIAAASNEQATGLAQIDTGIIQVSQVIQTNSATAEESAAASEELSGQSSLLKNRVMLFKLRGNASGNLPAHQKSAKAEYKEAAAATPEPKKINLDSKGFGKY